MNFRKMLRRQVYPTWISTTRLRGCKAYVKQTPNREYYFFEIVCYKDIQYTSLQDLDPDKIRFISFEDACYAAEQWIRDNVSD